MIQIIKLTEAIAVLETKAEDLVNLANNINSTIADLEAKTIITGKRAKGSLTVTSKKMKDSGSSPQLYAKGSEGRMAERGNKND